MQATPTIAEQHSHAELMINLLDGHNVIVGGRVVSLNKSHIGSLEGHIAELDLTIYATPFWEVPEDEALTGDNSFIDIQLTSYDGISVSARIAFNPGFANSLIDGALVVDHIAAYDFGILLSDMLNEWQGQQGFEPQCAGEMLASADSLNLTPEQVNWLQWFNNAWDAITGPIPFSKTELKDLADTLLDSTGADIWYDAHQYGDESAASSIEYYQAAIEKAARLIQYLAKPETPKADDKPATSKANVPEVYAVAMKHDDSDTFSPFRFFRERHKAEYLVEEQVTRTDAETLIGILTYSESGVSIDFVHRGDLEI